MALKISITEILDFVHSPRRFIAEICDLECVFRRLLILALLVGPIGYFIVSSRVICDR
jgi:hypothetical protein